MTRLIALLGVLCLLGWVAVWPPAGLLLAGAGLLTVAVVRDGNEKSGGA